MKKELYGKIMNMTLTFPGYFIYAAGYVAEKKLAHIVFPFSDYTKNETAAIKPERN